ncbi:MAG: hypothetical protein ACYC5K_09820, partial [Saccharofermentanales bacterium]
MINRVFLRFNSFKILCASFIILILAYSLPSIHMNSSAVSECSAVDIDVISADPELNSEIMSAGKSSEDCTVRIIQDIGPDLPITHGADIWVDDSVLEDESIRERMIRSYSDGGRVVILGQAQSRKGILEYFGEDTAEMDEVIEIPREEAADADSIAIARKLIGIMIYKENGVINTTSIYSDEDISEIYKLLLYVTGYDYVGLAAGSQDEGGSIICPAEVSAEPGNTWNSVKV